MKNLLISLIVTIFTLVFAYISSQGIYKYYNIPLTVMIVCISFFIHWIIFIFSFYAKTEKFYDITGTISYLSMVGIALFFVKNNESEITLRSSIVSLLVVVWALRLGCFLLMRVLDVGEDRRFIDAKKSFFTFLMFFSLSGMWTFITSSAALITILNNSKLNSDGYLIIGLILWIVGFSFEVIADEQKKKFRKNKMNKDNFIKSGLWSISRHPNYFGEILIWFSISIICYPALSGWQNITLFSPVFVYFLLVKISGVNLIEDSAEKKWGNIPEYQDYKKNIPMLFPFRFK